MYDHPPPTFLKDKNIEAYVEMTIVLSTLKLSEAEISGRPTWNA